MGSPWPQRSWGLQAAFLTSWSVRGPAVPEEGGLSGAAASPREEQAQQGAEEDQDLVKHGRLCPQDGAVEVILWDQAGRRQGWDPPPSPQGPWVGSEGWGPGVESPPTGQGPAQSAALPCTVRVGESQGPAGRVGHTVPTAC